MLSDLQLVYMGPRNSTQLLKINTTKFQVEREPVYYLSNLEMVFVQTDILESRSLDQQRGCVRLRMLQHLIVTINFAIANKD